MSSSISIRAVETADLPIITDFVVHSKMSLAINRLIYKDWPNEEFQRARYRLNVEDGFHGPSSPGPKPENLKAADDESSEIVGYLIFARKSPTPLGQEDPAAKFDRENQQDTWEGMNAEPVAEVNRAVAELAEGLMGVDHYEVTYMYVRPSHRRRGIGRKLMRLCFARAETDGIPLAVASEPAAHGFFRHLGFEDRKHVDFDLAKWAAPCSGFGIFRLAGMIWYPREVGATFG